jgi:alkylhydroperoxidase family enzyme
VGRTTNEEAGMATFLPPVEKPRGLMLKLVYFFTRRQFGKVATPIAVFSARMPTAFLTFYGKVSRLDKKLRLPSATRVLIRERVSTINGCAYCMDATRWYALRQSPEDVVRLDALPDYATSPLFTDAERAALDYTTELVTDKHVRVETFEHLARYYNEREVCDIAWLVASEHLYNLTNIGLNIGSDGLCELPSVAGNTRKNTVKSNR